jgi:hypothetical protein
MAYCGQPELMDYFNWSIASNAPEKMVACPFLDGGSGMPAAVLALFVFGAVGLALTYRVRHPGPIVVAFILTGGVAAIASPAPSINILAIVLFVGIAGAGLYLYQRSKNTL